MLPAVIIQFIGEFLSTRGHNSFLRLEAWSSWERFCFSLGLNCTVENYVRHLLSLYNPLTDVIVWFPTVQKVLWLVFSREYLHWLLVSNNELMAFTPSSPPKGSGFHRYIFLLFSQKKSRLTPGKFEKNSIKSRGKFKIAKYIKENQLGSLVAANFFMTSKNASWKRCANRFPTKNTSLYGSELLHKPFVMMLYCRLESSCNKLQSWLLSTWAFVKAHSNVYVTWAVRIV